MDSSSDLHAVIGVRYSGNLTYYVKRSTKMVNFPSVWSLLSIQFDPKWLNDPEDLTKVQLLMNKMSEERLGCAQVVVKKYLTSGNDPKNIVGEHIHLQLYKIDIKEAPQLNPEYYTEGKWLTAKEYESVSAGQKCGLCLRLWSDYAWMAGITDRPFVSSKVANHV